MKLILKSKLNNPLLINVIKKFKIDHRHGKETKDCIENPFLGTAVSLRIENCDSRFPHLHSFRRPNSYNSE